MFSRFRGLAIALLFVLVFGIFLLQNVKADSGPCSITVSPGLVNSNSQSNFSFTITNNDSSDPIRWIHITTPSDSYSINSASAAGWDGSVSLSDAYFTNNTVSPGDSQDIGADVSTAAFQDGESNWNIYASDNATGPGNFFCSLSAPVSMNDNSPHISNVSVSNVSANSITINWLTALAATSRVSYGLDDSYGSNSSDSQSTTPHSVKLSGLTPNTGYHYQVSSTTADGGNEVSTDSTFLTAIKEPGDPGLESSAISGPIGVVVTNPLDKKPPTISLSSTSAQKIYKTAPTLSGTAGDETAVVSVEYSTDGGKDWLPVDNASGIGTKTAGFSFTPLNLDDGNYSVLARAIDGGGNITVTPPLPIVIDRLPPLVGGSVLSLGPQVLQTNSSGEISTQAGVDEKITLSAVGGPTSIVLNAINSTAINSTKTFSLTKSADSGLWTGLISFTNPGLYSLAANSVDGAGNKTTKLISSVRVAPAAKLLKPNSQPIEATVTAYYLTPDTNTWVVWDGNAYGQDNPQTTDKAGSFNLFLPAGTYYLRAIGKDFAPITTNIFRLKTASPIVASLKAGKSGSFLSSLVSDFSIQPIGLNTSSQDKAGNLKNSLVGAQLPDFKLDNTEGQTVNAAGLLGRPTILSFMSSWAPTTSEQLPALNQLASNKDINVIPIALQQTAGEAGAYQAISGYNLSWLADPDSTTSANFSVSSLPTHYFINRSGTVKKIVIGVMSKQELLNNLASL